MRVPGLPPVAAHMKLTQDRFFLNLFYFSRLTFLFRTSTLILESPKIPQDFGPLSSLEASTTPFPKSPPWVDR